MEEKDTVNEIIMHPPGFWRKIKATNPKMLLTLELGLVELRSAMHGKKRADMRKQIYRAVALRRESRQRFQVSPGNTDGAVH